MTSTFGNDRETHSRLLCHQARHLKMRRLAARLSRGAANSSVKTKR